MYRKYQVRYYHQLKNTHSRQNSITAVFTLNFLPYKPTGPVSSNIYRPTINSTGPNLKTTLMTINSNLTQNMMIYQILCGHVNYALGLFQEKIPGGGGVETPSIIWGTTTRILIIFGVPPHKYKYLKWPPPRKWKLNLKQIDQICSTV